MQRGTTLQGRERICVTRRVRASGAARRGAWSSAAWGGRPWAARPGGSGAASRTTPSSHAQALSLPLLHAREPRASAKTLAPSGCKNSCVLVCEGNLSRGTGSSNPSFQTAHDVSKTQVYHSYETPLELLQSKQGLRRRHTSLSVGILWMPQTRVLLGVTA